MEIFVFHILFVLFDIVKVRLPAVSKKWKLKKLRKITGYIIQIKFEDRKYNQRDYIYSVSYLFGIPTLIIGSLALIFI